jgi:hypothetical protein
MLDSEGNVQKSEILNMKNGDCGHTRKEIKLNTRGKYQL